MSARQVCTIRPTGRTTVSQMGQRHSLEACELPPVKLTNSPDMAHSSNKPSVQARFILTLSMKGARTSAALIHIKTFVNSTFFSSSEYPLGYVSQSTVWPEPLREVENVSVGIELGDRSDKPSQLAMIMPSQDCCSFSMQQAVSKPYECNCSAATRS